MKFTRLLLVFIGAIFLLESCDPTTETKVPKATHLYFSDYNGKRVGVIDLSTPGSFTTLADASDGLDSLSGMAIDFKNGKIYIVEEWTNTIKRFNVDGSGFEILYDEADGVNMPTSIAVDGTSNSLFWGNSGSGQIMKGDLTGTAVIDTLYGEDDDIISYSYGMALDPKSKLVYFSDLGDFAGIWGDRLDVLSGPIRIFTPQLPGGGAISTTIRNPSGIFLDIDAGSIYWADEGLGTISLGNTGGTSSRVLFSREDGITRPDGIAVDKGSSKVYWTETDKETNTYTIFRGNLDGTEGREVILEGVESYCIVLKFDNQ